MNLQGKKIIITGAFGALGSTVAVAVHAAGGSVACIDSAAAPATRQLRGVVLGGIDLSSAIAANAALQEATQELGGLDGMVNLAGAFRWETIERGSTETWDLLYNVNVRTAVNATRAALCKLSNGGRIVYVGSAGATRAQAGMGAYAASKASVAKLTEALAEELKDRDITVNAVLPSIIDTPANRADMPHERFDRWVKAEQVADLIVFLLSSRATAITGALIPITGRV